MSVTLGKSPIIFSNDTDVIPQDGRNWCVSLIRFISAESSGVFIMLDKAGGREIARSSSMNVGDAEDINFDSQWFDGFYMQQCPGLCYVYYR